MNEYPRPASPDPLPQQGPQTSGAYPNQPQNQYGQNQPVNPQISQPYMQNPAHQAAPSPSTPPESAAKPKMSILLLSVLILAILMPILRVIEYGIMTSMVSSMMESIRQSFGEDIYQHVMANPEYYELKTVKNVVIVRLIIGIFFSIIYILFGIFIFLGYNWARIVLTVFTALNTLLSGLLMVSAIVDYGVSDEYMDFIDLHGYAAWLLIIYIAILVVGLLPLILMWLPPANRYVRQRTSVRRARNQANNPYGMPQPYAYPAPAPHPGQAPGNQPSSGEQQL
ncbi:hypothetical protein [Rothia dentocariosa]|uniref:hypothetical protein n=1 Tax=Rothia dentocariosa TaxID=2047 RepID=UPI00352C3E2B